MTTTRVPGAVTHEPREWSCWVRSGEWRTSVTTGIPTLPLLATEVIQIAQDPDVSIAQLARLVSKEPVLAARVLHMANAAYFAPLQEATSINAAIVRMGTAAIRNVVLAVSLASRAADLKAYGARGRDLLDHAIGTAYMARLMAETGGVDPDEMFLAGLLHDIGKLLLLKLAHDHSQCTGRPIDADELDEVIAERHAAIGAEVLRAWRLPNVLDFPVMYHHTPEKALLGSHEVAIIYMANRLSHRYGFGCPADPAFDVVNDIVAIHLGLTAEWLAATDRRAPGLFAVARRILN